MMYRMVLRHEGLNKSRVITGPNLEEVEARGKTQLRSWEEQWEKQRAAKARQLENNNKRLDQDKKKEQAALRTEESKRAICDLEKILISGTSRGVADWEQLRPQGCFSESPPAPPQYLDIPDPPSADSKEFLPKFGFLDYLSAARKTQRVLEAKLRIDASVEAWQDQCIKVEQQNESLERDYERRIQELECRRRSFSETLEQANKEVDELRDGYRRADRAAVEAFCNFVLSKSTYPDCIPKQWLVSFEPERAARVVEYQLPSTADLPTIKEVKYVASRDEYENTLLKRNEINCLYDSVVYQICLRTVRELFSADQDRVLKSITFNGWVSYINPATGTETRACIMSMQATPEEFSGINLAAVDPKTCFRSLKGVGSSQLHAMAPVPPLLRLNKEDGRFVASENVSGSLDGATNLAAIGWEEFEHLIREIFEREFSANGGEVKVTQSSRDGGVDAVAFDPDPIRGGKIVIQAKRYTNVVGVSAVRDLYGAVMNERANKGILVTTSSFGPDAYNFAKDKPLMLMDGSNLLFLLSKHGHRVRIDLNEAKMLGTSMQRHRAS